MTVRVALVGGPMYDRLYDAFEPGEVEVVVHADHPTLNRRVAEMLAAGERIDVLATHSKYAPSQTQWLWPLDDLVDPARDRALGAARRRPVPLPGLAALPAPADRRAGAVGARRSRRGRARHVGGAGRVRRRVRVPRPGVRPVRHVLRARRRARRCPLRRATGCPTMATPDAEHAIETLCRLAARAPDDLVDWHYDEVDAALLGGRVDAAAAWPGAWGEIRASGAPLVPYLYPAGPARRVSYAGCHAWAIPRTCGDLDGAIALVERLLGAALQVVDAAGGSMCAHRDALAAVEPRGRGRRAPPRDHPPDDRRGDDHLPAARTLPRDRGRGLVRDPRRAARCALPRRCRSGHPGRRRTCPPLMMNGDAYRRGFAFDENR